MPNTSAPRVGAHLTCENCGTGVIVVRPPAAAIACCGGVMGEPFADAPPAASTAATGTQLGKRHTCASCGAEVLVIKAGAAVPHCHDAEMALAATRQLPSSD
ncbi:hypothetical protein OG216_45010 [Streptomycetaceae bacterium NBC_01309]